MGSLKVALEWDLTSKVAASASSYLLPQLEQYGMVGKVESCQWMWRHQMTKTVSDEFDPAKTKGKHSRQDRRVHWASMRLCSMQSLIYVSKTPK